jgi:hypothetical protein
MPDAKGLGVAVDVSIPQHTSAYLSIPQHTSAYLSAPLRASALLSNMKALLEPACPALSALGSTSRQ